MTSENKQILENVILCVFFQDRYETSQEVSYFTLLMPFSFMSYATTLAQFITVPTIFAAL